MSNQYWQYLEKGNSIITRSTRKDPEKLVKLLHLIGFLDSANRKRGTVVMWLKELSYHAERSSLNQTCSSSNWKTFCQTSSKLVHVSNQGMIRKISIFHGCMVWIENLSRGSLIGITRLAE